MSFLKISDPLKRDAIVKEYLGLKKKIRDNFLSERIGESELQTDLSKFYRPITEKQKATTREITEGLKPIKEGLKPIKEGLKPIMEGIDNIPYIISSEQRIREFEKELEEEKKLKEKKEEKKLEEDEEEEEYEEEEDKNIGEIARHYLNKQCDTTFGIKKK